MQQAASWYDQQAAAAGHPSHAQPLTPPHPRPFLPLQVFQVLAAEGINMQMLSQGSSKTNISMVVDSSQGKRVVQLLHREFFEQQGDPANN